MATSKKGKTNKLGVKNSLVNNINARKEKEPPGVNRIPLLAKNHMMRCRTIGKIKNHNYAGV